MLVANYRDIPVTTAKTEVVRASYSRSSESLVLEKSFCSFRGYLVLRAPFFVDTPTTTRILSEIGGERTLTTHRKAKKRCDQGHPACGRCVRLGKACGGYRDLNDIMFRDQSASVARRASSGGGEASISAAGTLTRPPTPEKDTLTQAFFFEHFVTASHLSFLEGVTPDDLLRKMILACGLACIANRAGDERGREVARHYYVEAITATNTALRHPRRVKEDNTLISVFLLGMFEVRVGRPSAEPFFC